MAYPVTLGCNDRLVCKDFRDITIRLLGMNRAWVGPAQAILGTCHDDVTTDHPTWVRSGRSGVLDTI